MLSLRGYRQTGGPLLGRGLHGSGRCGWEPHLPLPLIFRFGFCACACATCSNRFCEAGEQTGGELGCRSGQGAQVSFRLALPWLLSRVCPPQCGWETEVDPWFGASLLRAWWPSLGSPLSSAGPWPQLRPTTHLGMSTRPKEVQIKKHCHEHMNSEVRELLGKPGVYYLLHLSRFSHVPTARRCAHLSCVAFPPFM